MAKIFIASLSAVPQESDMPEKMGVFTSVGPPGRSALLFKQFLNFAAVGPDQAGLTKPPIFATTSVGRRGGRRSLYPRDLTAPTVPNTKVSC